MRIDRGSADSGSRPRQGDAPGGAFDAVVFDLDGTLADTAEDLSDAMNRVLRGRGFAVHDVDAYKQMVGKGIRNLVTVALPPGARDEATVTACNDELLADYGEHCLVKTRLYPGITELLGALKAEGIPLAVFSNKAEDLTRRIVGALTAPGVFVAVVGARAGRPLKPDPTPALRLAELLGSAPARVAYVGDSDTDMRTAVAAGMQPVGVSWGFRSPAELVEHGAAVVLDHPTQLLDLLHHRGSRRPAGDQPVATG